MNGFKNNPNEEIYDDEFLEEIEDYDEVDSVDPLDSFENEHKAMSQIASALKSLSTDSRQRVLEYVLTLMGINPASTSFNKGSNFNTSSRQQFSPASFSPPTNTSNNFSDNRNISAKEFMLQKQPQTDVERIACLAYYLTHFSEKPHFKTIDISKLNTEAAQRKFTNAALTMKNALKLGYLVSVSKGNRQLSAGGEQFVLALPDRVAAKAAMNQAQPRRKSKKNNKKTKTEE